MSQAPEASTPQAEGTAWVDAIADLADGPHDMQALIDQGMMAQPQGDLEAAFTQFTWAAQAHPLDFWPQDALLELHLRAPGRSHAIACQVRGADAEEGFSFTKERHYRNKLHKGDEPFR
jgi:hypothetical protein